MTCPRDQGELVAYLDGEVTTNRAEDLEEHLRGCRRCEDDFERLSGAARALRDEWPEPRDERFVGEVMSSVRGAIPRRGARRWRWGAAAATLGLLVGVALWATLPSEEPHSTFIARGAEAAPARLIGFTAFVHARRGAGQPTQAGDGTPLAVGDGLSFQVLNRTGTPLKVMLFGLDARGDVHWFYPAWLDPATAPEATRLAGDVQVHDLPEGVTPADPAPGRFRVVAVFLADEAVSLTVVEVEELLADGDLPALQRARPDARLQVMALEMKR